MKRWIGPPRNPGMKERPIIPRRVHPSFHSEAGVTIAGRGSDPLSLSHTGQTWRAKAEVPSWRMTESRPPHHFAAWLTCIPRRAHLPLGIIPRRAHISFTYIPRRAHHISSGGRMGAFKYITRRAHVSLISPGDLMGGVAITWRARAEVPSWRITKPRPPYPFAPWSALEV